MDEPSAILVSLNELNVVSIVTEVLTHFEVDELY